MSKRNKEAKVKKKKRRWLGWVIAFGVIAILAGAGAIGWSALMAEHAEAASLPLNAVDFSTLKDGVYTGDYAGGMYKWRYNEVQVTVSSGKVTAIKLLDSADPAKGNAQQDALYHEVIDAQSLQVDALSGATLTSKAYLKAVENALLQAQEK